MSWLALQTKWRAPVHPGGAITEPLYINDDYIRYLFAGVPTISLKTKIGYSLTVNGEICLPDYISYAGYMGFNGSTYHIWRDVTYGWVASTLPIGSPLHEYWDRTDMDDITVGAYNGTAFYSVGIVPVLGNTATAHGRGILRGTVYAGISSNTLTIGTNWEYWQSSDVLYGKYSPKGTASEDRYFGSPQWKNGTTKYCRTPTVVSGKFDYGDIVWNDDASKYVLGSYNSESGWHEASSAPTVESSWTLNFEKPEGSEADGENITLEWDDWVLGTYTKNISVMRANKWVG